MFERIDPAILERLGDRSWRFVFPSEVAARDALRRSLVASGRFAIEAGRFLSWDAFKESCARRAEDERPCNACLRLVYASAFLARNAEEGLLAEMVPPPRAAEAAPFAPWLAGLLPSLGALADRAAGRKDAWLKDYRLILDDYRAFMAGRRLFEPSYRAKEPRPPEGLRFLVAFPELVEDFDEFALALGSHPSVHIVSEPPLAERPGLAPYPTAMDEIKACLLEAGRLMDGGMAAHELAITVGDLDAFLPYLEREARLLGLPLDIRAGKPFSSYASGRLFSSLSRAVSSGFAYESLRELLLCPAYPWKEAGRNRRLLAFGLERNCLSPWKDAAGRPVDAWEASFPGRLGKEDEDLRRHYAGLRSLARGYAEARDFAALRKAFRALNGALFDRGAWDSTEDAVLARCLLLMDDFIEAQETAGNPALMGSPASIFEAALKGKRYVAQGGRGGIPVYDYRVSAGVAPKVHFLLDCGQDSLSISYRAFPFLREDRKASLDSVDRDASSSFLEAYARSGDLVLASVSAKGIGGAQAPCAWFGKTPAREVAQRDPWRLEREAFASPGPEGLGRDFRAPAAMKAGWASREALAGSRGGPRLTLGDRLSPGTASRLIEGKTVGGGLRLAATELETIAACPFAWLLGTALKAYPAMSAIDVADGSLLGRAYHGALEGLFDRVEEEDGRFLPAKVGVYASWLDACLDASIGRLVREEGPFVEPVFASRRAAMLAYLRLFLRNEARAFPEARVEGTELELERLYPESRVVLTGRLDRLSLDAEGGAIVVDYKKGRTPRRNEIAGKDGEAPSSFQIPAYVRLLEGRGLAVARAVWYSLEGEGEKEPGFANALGGEKAYIDEEGLPAVLASFDVALLGAAEGLREGSYPAAPKARQGESCPRCRLKAVCRERYALKLELRDAEKALAAAADEEDEE